jgi:hypothetical protein
MNVPQKNVRHGSRARALKWNATPLNYVRFNARLVLLSVGLWIRFYSTKIPTYPKSAPKE